ncbi:hypothetical protein STPYR_10754 [uncultured Stenotrophomonas sp.]|uniref:Uncharacterized protein n=1 Tax=uncultured Stenotrophomonas sp. TaxID=165438 RepID=A0A1Y5Q849_9GAMM|nr:hypothetical protein STPYR_10754 [uncultured Stenotrophomonas sp.]
MRAHSNTGSNMGLDIGAPAMAGQTRYVDAADAFERKQPGAVASFSFIMLELREVNGRSTRQGVGP